MKIFELLPEGAIPTVEEAHHLVWPSAGGDSGTVRSNVSPWLSEIGSTSDAAIDLVRIAAGALMADRLSSRGQGFSRTIQLHVQLVDHYRWNGLLDGMADFLHWLTGDEWQLELSSDGLNRPSAGGRVANPDHTVTLLSGGLDSLCGAAIASHEGLRQIFLSHWDNTIIKGSQDRTYRWLGDVLETPPQYLQLRFAQSEPKRESSSRSRSFLFMALATAVGEAYGIARIAIPENGFTSVNPPLGPDRGGALSTRSTHPWTLERMNNFLTSLQLAPRVHNPYAFLTKGELLARAADTKLGSFIDAAAGTLSCGKIDGRIYKGGNPNHHCGLCVPCLVRKGAFLAAGVQDKTPYLSEYLPAEALAKLHARRADDVSAVRLALEQGIDDVQVMALGPFPDTFDLEAAVELCIRGLGELSSVSPST